MAARGGERRVDHRTEFEQRAGGISPIRPSGVLLEFLPPLFTIGQKQGVKTPAILKMLDFDKKKSRLRRENPFFGVFRP